MLFYSLILVVLLFLSNTKIRYTQSFFFFVCFILAVILGFRSLHVGVDTHSYANYYNYASYNVGHMEPGWNLLIYVCKLVGLTPFGFNFLIALITFICLAFPVNKMFTDNHHKMLAMFFLVAMGFYFLMFNGMRQTTSMSICFFAFYLIDQNKTIKSIILILLASTLHASCLLTLPAIFLKKIPPLKLPLVLTLLFASMVIGVLASKQFYVTIAGRYAYDVLVDEAFNSNPYLYFITMVLLSNLFFIFLFILTSKKLHNNYWFKLYFVAMIIQSILFQLTYGQRIVYYYSLSCIVLFPLLMITAPKKSKVELSLGCYLLGLAFFLRFMLQETPGVLGSLIPYSMTLKPF